MARSSTGACTVYASRRIELSWLLKNNYIKKNCICSGTITFHSRYGNTKATIGIRSSYLPNGDNYIQLVYTVTDDGKNTDYDYKINLIEVPSNLGKGSVLYFRCPTTWKKCRILYMAYGHPKFVERSAYRKRLYYDCQQSSKLSKYNDNFWRLESHLKELKDRSCTGRRSFKGKLTKAAQRYNRLWRKQSKMDDLRWTLGAPKSIRQMLLKEGLL